jgi:hypothetical protein
MDGPCVGNAVRAASDDALWPPAAVALKIGHFSMDEDDAGSPGVAPQTGRAGA